VADVQQAAPDEADVADAVNYVSTLMKSGQVAWPGHLSPSPGTTHRIEVDNEGRRRLVRSRFSLR
jgi:hypothetical protein